MTKHDKIRYDFLTKDFKKFNDLLKREYRVYAIELEIRTDDGKKYVDLVLEDEEKRSITIIEFKSDLIDYGAVEQSLRYADITHKQVWRKQDKYKAIIIGPEFSSYEIQVCKKMKVIPIQYQNNKFRIPNE